MEMESVILCLNTEFSIILEFISSKSFGGKILQLSINRKDHLQFL